jgi:hypothetical protein
MAIKYINIFQSKALKLFPKLGFCFENKPSGNPVRAGCRRPPPASSRQQKSRCCDDDRKCCDDDDDGKMNYDRKVSRAKKTCERVQAGVWRGGGGVWGVHVVARMSI